MDKYQSHVLNELSRSIVSIYAYADSKTVNVGDGLYDEKLNRIKPEEKIEIKQNDDITNTKYELFFINQAIAAVYAIKETECIPFCCALGDFHWSGGKISKDQQIFHFTLDFDDKIESVKIVFKNELANDLTIPVEFIDADKEAYYAKKEAERLAEIKRKAAVSCATGMNLVNIYFQPCSDNYAKTEIVLYRSGNMLAKYSVAGEIYYKAISDLACGDYSFILKQTSANEEVLFETEHICFSISMPKQSSGKNHITWVT